MHEPHCRYGEEELIASMERIEVVDFMQTLEVAGGIKVRVRPRGGSGVTRVDAVCLWL